MLYDENNVRTCTCIERLINVYVHVYIYTYIYIYNIFTVYDENNVHVHMY